MATRQRTSRGSWSNPFRANEQKFFWEEEEDHFSHSLTMTSKTLFSIDEDKFKIDFTLVNIRFTLTMIRNKLIFTLAMANKTRL